MSASDLVLTCIAGAIVAIFVISMAWRRRK